MKYNFIEFKGKGTKKPKNRFYGLTLGDSSRINHPDFKLECGIKIDIFIDEKKQAIKIIEGTGIKLYKIVGSKFAKGFCSRNLFKEFPMLKKGRYEYVGDNIFQA